MGLRELFGRQLDQDMMNLAIKAIDGPIEQVLDLDIQRKIEIMEGNIAVTIIKFGYGETPDAFHGWDVPQVGRYPFRTDQRVYDNMALFHMRTLSYILIVFLALLSTHHKISIESQLISYILNKICSLQSDVNI